MEHNHVLKVAALIREGYLKGWHALASNRLNIYHDDTCGLLLRSGRCDCDPVIEEVTRDRRGQVTSTRVLEPGLVPVTGCKKE